MCVCVCPKFPDANWKFSFFFPPPLQTSLISHHAHRQDRQSQRKAFQLVLVYMHVCVCVQIRAFFNPFCQALAQPFLSKLPAWSWSPLVLLREARIKGPVGLPLLPGPVRGHSAPQRPGSGIWSAPGPRVAAVTDASIASPWDVPAQTPHSLSHLGNGWVRVEGGRDNYTHIQQPPPRLMSTILQLWCMAIYQSYKKTFAKFLVFRTTCKLA